VIHKEGVIRHIWPLPATTFTPPPHHLPERVDTVSRHNDVTPSPLPVATRCQLSGVADTGATRARVTGRKVDPTGRDHRLGQGCAAGARDSKAAPDQ
jgi:hypothetical protein